MTQVKVTKNRLGAREVIIIDDNMTPEEKIKLKYAIYKSINESYKKLMKFLPKES